MNRKMLVIIALQAFIMVILFWMLVFYGKDEFEAGLGDDDDEVISSPSLVNTEHGATTITLTTKTQQLSGIATSRLQAVKHLAEVASFGEVVAVDTLIEQRTSYLAALAEAEVVRAALVNSRQDYERLKRLNQDDRNVSDRAAAAAQATWRADEAKLAAAGTAAANWHDAMRQQWGATITQWATQQPSAAPLQRLLQHREVLLQVTVPFDAPALAADTPVYVAPAGSSDDVVKAVYVSTSPRVDSTLQGRTYYFRAPADNLRVGMRLTVRLQTQKQAKPGFIVPDSAVVWFANQPWVYQKAAQDKFIRRLISTDIETPKGWFNAESQLKAGDEIVTTGAQLLLSEEFKYQIKNENED